MRRSPSGRQVRGLFLAAAMLWPCGPAAAQQTQPDADRIAAARALIEAQGGRAQTRKAYDQMMAAMTAEVGRRSPSEAESFQQFVQKHFAAESPRIAGFFDGAIEALVAFYAERCTVEELKAITAFLQSAAGQKLTAIAPEAATVMFPKLLELQKAVAAEVRAAAQRGELKQ